MGRRTLIIAFAIGLVAIFVTPSTLANSTAAPGLLKMKTAGARLLSQKDLGNGQALARWSVGKVEVTAAAPVGSVVTVTPGSGDVSASVTTPSPDKQSIPDVPAYVSSGQALINNAIAVGYTPAQARAMAARQGVHVTTATATSATGAPETVQLASAYYNGEIIASPCASVSGDGGYANARGCDVQKMLQYNSNGDWYLGDSQTGTGNEKSAWYNPDGLAGLRTQVRYGSGNSIVQWRPNTTIPEGSCTTNTVSLGYNGTGVSASSTVCPSHMSPDFNSSYTWFGPHWSGCLFGDYAGVDGVDITHSPPSASASVTMNVTMWWNWC